MEMRVNEYVTNLARGIQLVNVMKTGHLKRQKNTVHEKSSLFCHGGARPERNATGQDEWRGFTKSESHQLKKMLMMGADQVQQRRKSQYVTN